MPADKATPFYPVNTSTTSSIAKHANICRNPYRYPKPLALTSVPDRENSPRFIKERTCANTPETFIITLSAKSVLTNQYTEKS